MQHINGTSYSAFDDFGEPVDSFVDSGAVQGVRFLNVPRTVSYLVKTQLLGYFLLRVRVWQICLIRKEEHRKLPIADVYLYII